MDRGLAMRSSDEICSPTPGGFYLKTFVGPTPAPWSPVVGGRNSYVAAALLGDGPAAWHLATSAEAADRGLATRSSDEIYSEFSYVRRTITAFSLDTAHCTEAACNTHFALVDQAAF